MNAELLLENFHRLGDAPDAVPRLRHFILDLAVRGKLVEHEPGSAFVYLSELCTSRSGNSTIIKGKISAEPGEGLYPAFSASGQDVWHSSYEHEGDAVIVSAVGARCGKAFLATGKWSAIANTHILFPKADRCTLSYLHLIANNEALWIRGGSAQPFVRVSKTLEAREVYLPTFPEQHRIVAKVEELMALCDRLEAAQQQREAERTRLTAAAWQAVVQAEAPADVSFALEQLPALTTRPAQVKALRQTILDLAVRGRLVEQEEGEALAPKYLQEPIGDGLPASWRMLNFDKYFDVQGGNQPPKSQFISEPRTGYVRLFQIRDLGEKPVPTYIPVKSTKRFSKRGEILIGRYGASIGKVFWAQDGAYNVALAKFIYPSDALLPEFAFLVLKSAYFQGALINATRSAQAGFNKGDLAAIDFPTPPLAEQRRIVAKVEELMALCDGLEAALAAGEALRGKVLEAVVRSDDQMIRRSDNGPRPEVVQKPKVRVPRYVEPEEELELAVAAEPVGHTGAMQAVVRRGPGRPRKSDAPAGAQSGSVIPMERVLEPTAVPGEVEDWITHSDMEAGIRRTFLPGMRMQREAALRALAIAKGHGRLGKHIKEEMEVLLDELLYSGLLVEEAAGIGLPGHATEPQIKRGPGRPRKGESPVLVDAQQAIAAYLHAHPGWHGKAAILEATGVEAGAWNAAIKELLEAGKVERQGEKKGARYRGR